ncbi:MAG TPA: hypothetical protein DCE42_13275 [Myxococcales bacterium]|nr:hypothetical protein [Deltaproteobacteria bacterium]MBU48139.1 hypothetical protein [Deltaproteobacteria bacterium]HAA55728.1 hypothetical protein [Myxococcales bacterium]|tara:strand:- start:27321 stop:28316 length:996 start_codon:yes stop_codon:yes gene_type:complete
MSRDILWIEADDLKDLFSQVEATPHSERVDAPTATYDDFVLLPQEELQAQLRTHLSPPRPPTVETSPPHKEPLLQERFESPFKQRRPAQPEEGVGEAHSAFVKKDAEERSSASFHSLHAALSRPLSHSRWKAAPAEVALSLSKELELAIGFDVQDDIEWSLPPTEDHEVATEELPEPETMPIFTGNTDREGVNALPLPSSLRTGDLQERLDAFLTWLMPSTGSYMAYIADGEGLPLASVFATDEYLALGSLLPPQILFPLKMFFPEQYQESVLLHQLSFQLNEEYFLQLFWMTTSLGPMTLGLVLPEALSGAQLHTLYVILMTILKETKGQ